MLYCCINRLFAIGKKTFENILFLSIVDLHNYAVRPFY